MKRHSVFAVLPALGSSVMGLHRSVRLLGCLLAFLAAPGLLATSTALRAASDLTSMDAAAASMARVIVKFKEGTELTKTLSVDASVDETVARDLLQRRADVLSSRVGVTLTSGRAVGPRGQVLMARGLSAQALAAKLAQDPHIEYAEVDRIRRALWVPTDPLYATGPANGAGPAVGQWYLRAPDATFLSAANLPGAWDRTRGASSMVVAVLDSGILKDHPDLQGQYLAGYDFIDNAAVANDGDRRDADPADPGDWITSAEDKNTGGFFHGCGASSSSWHGTQVASIIAAATNNGIGMAGIASNAKVLPVRVLGKCGGYDSDIQAAMYWSAGVDQTGVPANPTPAKVINMSLGSDGTCPQSYKDVMSAVTAKGVVVVAAAGNSAGLAVGTPANCPGVLAIGGLRHIGTKVGFSDLGPEIAISAPGGNCVNLTGACLYPIITALNSGTQGPVAGGYTYSDSTNASVGTSFSSPIVAGTVALMMSANPSLTPADVKRILQTTARAFPTTGSASDTAQCKPPTSTEQLECYCTTTTCGAGMLDAAAAVAASVVKPVAKAELTTASPTAGSSVQVTAANSTVGPGRTVAAYAWTLKDGGGVATGFSTATNAATAALLPSGAGTVVVQVTVTDDLGVQASADLSIVVAAAPVPPTPTPTPTPSNSGGGGAMSVVWLLALWFAAWLLRRQGRRPSRSA